MNLTSEVLISLSVFENIGQIQPSVFVYIMTVTVTFEECYVLKEVYLF